MRLCRPDSHAHIACAAVLMPASMSHKGGLRPAGAAKVGCVCRARGGGPRRRGEKERVGRRRVALLIRDKVGLWRIRDILPPYSKKKSVSKA